MLIICGCCYAILLVLRTERVIWRKKPRVFKDIVKDVNIYLTHTFYWTTLLKICKLWILTVRGRERSLVTESYKTQMVFM